MVSVVVARSQHSLARKDQLFPLVGGLLDEFRDADFKKRLAYIEESLATDSPPDSSGEFRLSAAARAQVGPVMGYFNNIGLLVANDAVPVRLASAIMGGSVINAWTALAPYVYAERLRRGGDPNYYGYFEHLAASIAEVGPERLERLLQLKKLPPARSTP